MSKTSIKFGGHSFTPYPCGALYWPDQDMLVISDLHFEKSSHFAAKGQFLPPYDTAETLDKLCRICSRVKPQKLLFLGDVFHDPEAMSRMDTTCGRGFGELLSAHAVIWVDGNHDKGTVPQGVEAVDTAQIDTIRFSHEATDRDGYEISGHYHPSVSFKHRGVKVRRPCFVHDDRRLIVPSFGVLTGGLDLHDSAYKTILNGQTNIYALGQNQVYKVAA